MEINLGQQKQGMAGVSSRGGKIPQGATIISQNLQKKSIMVDREGNQIDPITKRIIKLKNDTTQ